MGTEPNNTGNNLEKLLSRFTGWRGKRRIAAPPSRSIYMHHLEAECRAMFEESDEPAARTLIARLDEMKKMGSADPFFPDWHDINRFELEFVARLLPKPQRLRRKVWNLRERYKNVVGQHDYELYLASKPPEPTTSQEEELLADAEFLLKEIHLRYAFTPVFESVRRSKLKKVAMLTLTGIVLAAGIVLWFGSELSKLQRPGTMLMVLFVGAMGGLASMLQRYQNLPTDGDLVDNLNELSQAGTYLPALSGAVFAMVFYVMIASGLVQGDLFPSLLAHKAADSGNKVAAMSSLFDLIENARAVRASDYAKLIVWSFISGFAERFVPDRLAGFIARK